MSTVIQDAMLPVIDIKEFDYPLPDDRIARYPLAQRDASKLLVWDRGHVGHRIFSELPSLLDGNSVLFFNNTRVIPARLFFRKDTGALIEAFLLGPAQGLSVEEAMQARGRVVWDCAIGRLKYWKDGQVLERTLELDGRQMTVRASLVSRTAQQVAFEWTDNSLSFLTVVEALGAAPIPPYLNRAAEESDKQRYQTVYSKREGAVAAPTAGLHFTPELIRQITDQGIRLEELTLHVSAGTFRPVKAENAADHDMHYEQVQVYRSNLEALLEGKKNVAVGTTSMRTLESLYWYGAGLLRGDFPERFEIDKAYPYQHEERGLPSRKAAILAVLDKMERAGEDTLRGSTGIYIMPGYRFRVVDELITNFHQPCSTLLLLISAFVGVDRWRSIYDAALENGYRFLSYGDSSYLRPGPPSD